MQRLRDPHPRPQRLVDRQARAVAGGRTGRVPAGAGHIRQFDLRERSRSPVAQLELEVESLLVQAAGPPEVSSTVGDGAEPVQRGGDALLLLQFAKEVQ